MLQKLLLILALLIVVSRAFAAATILPVLTAPVDPSQLQYYFNLVISAINNNAINNNSTLLVTAGPPSVLGVNPNLAISTLNLSGLLTLSGPEGAQLEWSLGGQVWKANVQSNGAWYLSDVTHSFNPLTIKNGASVDMDIGFTAINAVTISEGGINTTQSASGILSSLNGNSFIVNFDSANLGGNFGGAVIINHVFGTSAMYGGRQTFSSYGYLTSPSNVANTNRNYVSGTFVETARSGDGGTGLTPTTAMGAFFSIGAEATACGVNDNVGLCGGNSAGATNILELTGGEINVAAHDGSSVLYKSIWTLVGRYDDAVRGSTYDTMLSFSANPGAVTWNNGITFDVPNGEWPISTSGNLISAGTCPALTPGQCSAANGVNLLGVQFSGYAFESNQFFVDQNGAMWACGGNYQAAPASHAAGQTCIWNYAASGGQGEVSVFNDYNNAPLSFAWWQKTGASTASELFSASTGSFNIYTNGVLALTVGTGGTLEVAADAFSANGTTALALTALGPAGAHATVQEWFTVTDAGGTVRYIPAF